jgi:hypothetical protein
MVCLRLRAALAIPLIVVFWTNASAGSQSLFKLPCMISYNGSPSIATDCEVSSTLERGYTVERVRTPNGKSFILENGKSEIDEWYLNHQKATKVSDEPNPCYRSALVEICF